MEVRDRLLIILSLGPKGCRWDRSLRCCLMGFTTKAPRSQSCLLSALRSWGRFFRWGPPLVLVEYQIKTKTVGISIELLFLFVDYCTANVCSNKWMSRKKKLNRARCPISVMVDCCCKINGLNDCGNSDLDFILTSINLNPTCTFLLIQFSTSFYVALFIFAFFRNIHS